MAARSRIASTCVRPTPRRPPASWSARRTVRRPRRAEPRAARRGAGRSRPRPRVPEPGAPPATAARTSASSAKTAADRASASRTAGLKCRSRYGSSSWRTRLRAMARSALLGSSRAGEPARGQVVEHVAARQGQHRPEQVARARPHRGRPEAARAAKEAQEHGLGLVVAGVGEGDPGGALFGLDRAAGTRGAPAAPLLRARRRRARRRAPRPPRRVRKETPRRAHSSAQKAASCGRIRPQP